MNEDPPLDYASAPRPDVTAAVKGTALGALLAGGVCLYFGFAWLVDAPGSASEEATPAWYAVDQVFLWALRIIGVAFLAVAALAMTGNRMSALLGAVVEGFFALLMLAMAVETFLEARADGTFDATVILLLIIMVVGISAARYSWSLYARSAPSSPFETD